MKEIHIVDPMQEAILKIAKIIIENKFTNEDVKFLFQFIGDNLDEYTIKQEIGASFNTHLLDVFEKTNKLYMIGCKP